MGTAEHITTSKIDRHYLRIKGRKKIFQANGPRKKAGVAVLISNKINIKLKLIKRYGEEYYILIKGKIYEDDILMLSIYTASTRAPIFVKTKQKTTIG